MSIYMSFRVAQDHNKAVSRDTTSSTATSTQQEDPVATTRRHSSCFAFSCHSLSFGFPSRELHCQVVELVSVLLVINYLVDLMMCVIICCVNYIPVYCACFGGSPSEEATKIDSSKSLKLLYLTNIRAHASDPGRPWSPIYSSVNQRIYGPTCQIHASAPRPGIFIGDVSPMNVTGYIRRFHITDECIVTFIGTDK
jgi:hypothetical protein